MLAQPTALPRGSRVQIMVRPEQVLLTDNNDNGQPRLNSLAGTIEIAKYLGQMIRYFVRAGDTTITVREPRRPGARGHVGDPVRVAWSGEVTAIFPAAGTPTRTPLMGWPL